MAKKKEIDLERVKELSSQGLTTEQIASCLGISRTTFYKNRKSDSEHFEQAFKDGRALGIQKITNKLFEAAESGAPWAICFYLKTVAGWSEKDKQEVQISGEVTQKIYQYGWAGLAGVPETGIKDNDKGKE